MRIRITGAALAAIVVALAGCGGDDGADPRPPASKPASSTAASKPEFIRQADAICAEADRLLAPIERSTGQKAKQGDAKGTAEEIRKSLPIATAQLDKLRALTPPADGRGAVTDYLDTVTSQIGLTGGLADAIEAGDGERTKSLSAELKNGKQRAQDLAEGYGFEECGSDD